MLILGIHTPRSLSELRVRPATKTHRRTFVKRPPTAECLRIEREKVQTRFEAGAELPAFPCWGLLPLLLEPVNRGVRDFYMLQS